MGEWYYIITWVKGLSFYFSLLLEGSTATNNDLVRGAMLHFDDKFALVQ